MQSIGICNEAEIACEFLGAFLKNKNRRNIILSYFTTITISATAIINPIKSYILILVNSY